MDKKIRSLASQGLDISSSVGSKVVGVSGHVRDAIQDRLQEEAYRVSDYGWKGEMFDFRAALHHGVPGSPVILTYDPIQKLLAIGTAKGLVKVFGKPGVEVVVNQFPTAVSHMVFMSNQGRLVIVHSGNTIESIHLGNKRVIGSHSFTENITCMHALHNSQYVVLGMGSGNINVFDTARAAACTYHLSARRNFEMTKPGRVVALETCPTEPSILLVGYSSGGLVEIDLGKQELVRTYELGTSLTMDTLRSLTTAVWSPKGNKILVGFKSGDLIMWRRGTERAGNMPYKHVQMSYHPRTKRRPIMRLFWSRFSFSGKSLICALGGTSSDFEQETVMVRYQKQLTELDPKGFELPEADPNNSSTVIVDCVLATPSTLPGSINPVALIAVTAAATITVYQPASSSGQLLYVSPPPEAQLQQSKVTSTLFCTVDRKFITDLSQTGTISWRSRNWPILGGSASNQTKKTADLLVTGHANGVIHFWDMSTVQFLLLYSLDIKKYADPPPRNPHILTLDLCHVSRVLVCSCIRGETFIFHFNEASSTFHVVTASSSRRIAEPRQSAPTGDVRNALSELRKQTSPRTQSMDSLCAASDEEEEESHSSTSSSPYKEEIGVSASVSGPGEGKFSWRRFFMNAGIDKDTAKSYQKIFNDQKMTEDLIPQLDKDMLDMMGITAVGDKMRIWKYSNSEYSREKCLSFSPSSSSSSAAASHPSTPPSIHSQNKTRSITLSSVSPRIDDASTSLAGSPSRRSVDLSKLGKEKDAEHQVSAGFSLLTQCAFLNPITKIKIASSLSKVAVGDRDGNVALVNIFQGTVLLHKTLATDDGRSKSPVCWLCFDDRAMVKKSKSNKIGEPGLYVGLADGRIFYIALKTAAVDELPIECYSEQESILSDIVLVNGLGAVVGPAAAPWKTQEQLRKEQEKEEKERQEKVIQMQKMEEELVIRDLDKEREMERKMEKKARSTNSSHGSANMERIQQQQQAGGQEMQKYLIVLADHAITIYAIPSYRVYSNYNCRELPVSANIVEREKGNFCLVVFLASGDVQVFTLLDLNEIKMMPSALQRIGVQYNPKALKHDVNCSPDGRFIVISKFQEIVRGSLFTDENQLGIPQSLPILHIPHLPFPDVESDLLALINGPSGLSYMELFGKLHSKTKESRPSSRGGSGGGSVRGGSARPSQSQAPPKQVQSVKNSQSLQSMVGGVSEKVFSTVGKGVGQVGGGINDIKEMMTENFNSLSLRQEKLDLLLNQTADLEKRSGGFAAAAEQVAKSQGYSKPKKKTDSGRSGSKSSSSKSKSKKR